MSKAKPEGAASPATLHTGMTLLEDYRIEGILGEGGLGRVALVRSSSTGQQYAVKRATQFDGANREKFLSEVQAWINLPEHPHLVACRFVREVGQEIFLFSEFVPGGALVERVRGRKMAIEQVLDVAIQMAWGLHAVHEAGVVHQDVKPSNVLVTTDGIAKIADFGLARARQRGGERTGKDSRGPLVSMGGLTPAYCSPEQVEGERLTRQTDVWSWGLSVLEMFTGEVTWTSGAAALDALKDYLANGGRRPGLPVMPEPFVPILRRCFKWQPDDRWETLGATAGAVASVYARVVGKPYNRPSPVRSKGPTQRRAPGASQAVTRAWANPGPWLVESILADGKQVEELDKLLPPPQSTRRDQAIADLGTYEKARQVLVRLVKAGRDELLPALACLYLDNAWLLEWTGDPATALLGCDQVIKVYHHLVDRKGIAELLGELALGYESKADVLHRQRRSREAADLFDKAIALWESHVQRETCMAHHARLAVACAKKAEALRSLGDHDEVPNLCRRATAGLGQLSKHPAAIQLAAAHVTEAHTYHVLGDYAGAVSAADKAVAICRQLIQRAARVREARQQVAELLEPATGPQGQRQALSARARLHNFDQAIAVLERRTQEEGQFELAGDLARAYHGKELDQANQEQRPSAAALPEVCSTLMELLRHEGRDGLARHLLAAYGNPGNFLSRQEPAAQLDRYVFHYERLVRGVEESELHARQAEALLAKSLAHSGRGDDRSALAAGEQALAIWGRLARVEGLSEFAQQLAAGDAVLARLLACVGEQEKARSHYDQAIAGYEQLIEREGRTDLVDHLTKVKESRALLGDGGRRGDKRN